MSYPVTIDPEFVEFIPAEPHPGVLYVSMAFSATAHLCPCGCGNRVDLPLSPAQWHLYFDGDTLALTPSIGNWGYPCQSHYWIRNNTILWARRWSHREIDQARRRSAATIGSYFSDRPTSGAGQDRDPEPERPIKPVRGWFTRRRRRASR